MGHTRSEAATLTMTTLTYDGCTYSVERSLALTTTQARIEAAAAAVARKVHEAARLKRENAEMRRSLKNVKVSR